MTMPQKIARDKSKKRTYLKNLCGGTMDYKESLCPFIGKTAEPHQGQEKQEGEKNE